jgi:PKD repeat protein
MSPRRRVGLLAALACLALPAAAAPSALAAFGEVNAFGAYGTGQGQFKFAQFLDVDTQRDQLLVGDFNSALDFPMRIVPFTSGGSALPTYATDTASLSTILDGAVDVANRRAYIVELDRPSADDPPPEDYPGDFIVQIGLDGGHTQSFFAEDAIGKAVDVDTGLATGRLDPLAIAVVPTGTTGAGNVYVAGTIGTARGRSTHLAVVRFDSSGRRLNEIGAGNASVTRDAEPGRFNATTDGRGIRGLAVDPRDGSVWVLDGFDDDGGTLANEDYFGRVQHFRADGTFIEQIVTSSDHPIYAAGTNADVAVGADGSVWLDTYVEAPSGGEPDYGVIRFAPQGGGGYAEAQRFGAGGTGSCEFPAPPLLAIDGSDAWTATDAGPPIVSPPGYAKVKLFGTGGSGCGGGNADPVITPGSVQATPATPLKGQMVSFTAAATDDGPANELRWQWDLDGDGGYETTASSSPTARTTVARTGPVSVRVRVTDADGGSDEATLDLVVTSQKPTASFTASTTTPLAGESVQFDASGSSDPDGTIARYEWDTGSGFHAGGSTLSASFDAGARTVRLRVTDSDGDVSAIARKDLTVSAPPPPPPATTSTNPPPGAGGSDIDTTAPDVTLGAPRQSGVSGLTVPVGCPGGETSCAGTVTLETAKAVAARRGKHKPKRVLKLGSASFSVGGGAQTVVRVRLSSAARKLLAHGKLKVRLVVRVADAAGNVSTSTRTLTLKPPAKKHRR